MGIFCAVTFVGGVLKSNKSYPIMNKGALGHNVSLANAEEGIHALYAHPDAPFNYGTLVCMKGGPANVTVQLGFHHLSPGDMYLRFYWDSWTAWRKVASTAI